MKKNWLQTLLLALMLIATSTLSYEAFSLSPPPEDPVDEDEVYTPDGPPSDPPGPASCGSESKYCDSGSPSCDQGTVTAEDTQTDSEGNETGISWTCKGEPNRYGDYETADCSRDRDCGAAVCGDQESYCYASDIDPWCEEGQSTAESITYAKDSNGNNTSIETGRTWQCKNDDDTERVDCSASKYCPPDRPRGGPACGDEANYCTPGEIVPYCNVGTMANESITYQRDSNGKYTTIEIGRTWNCNDDQGRFPPVNCNADKSCIGPPNGVFDTTLDLNYTCGSNSIKGQVALFPQSPIQAGLVADITYAGVRTQAPIHRDGKFFAPLEHINTISQYYVDPTTPQEEEVIVSISDPNAGKDVPFYKHKARGQYNPTELSITQTYRFNLTNICHNLFAAMGGSVASGHTQIGNPDRGNPRVTTPRLPVDTPSLGGGGVGGGIITGRTPSRPTVTTTQPSDPVVVTNPQVEQVIGDCGNGELNLGEQCDDGNKTSADGCSATCQVEEGFCWETNDAQKNNLEDGCLMVLNSFAENLDEDAPAQLQYVFVKNVCGDGYVHKGVEECDDKNNDNGDGCIIDAEANYMCKNAFCGDGYISKTTGEQCDDGNSVGGDGCDEMCIIEDTDPLLESNALSADSIEEEQVCGNGIIEEGEMCDGDEGCNATCTYDDDFASASENGRKGVFGVLKDFLRKHLPDWVPEWLIEAMAIGIEVTIFLFAALITLIIIGMHTKRLVRYTMTEGETLESIAFAHAITERKLRKFNRKGPKWVPKPGSRIKVPNRHFIEKNMLNQLQYVFDDVMVTKLGKNKLWGKKKTVEQLQEEQVQEAMEFAKNLGANLAQAQQQMAQPEQATAPEADASQPEQPQQPPTSPLV